jgi:hypothetical protein
MYGRLDAEFVDPDLLAQEERLRADHKGKLLSNLTDGEVATYTRPKDESEVMRSYVAIDNIDAQDGFLFSQTLPEKELPGRAKHKLKAGDIVVSNVRPERGAVGLVLPSQDGHIGSSGLSVIRVDDKQDRNVLFAYLRSRYARSQLIRRSRGSMYPAVTKDDVAEIIVPEFSAKAKVAIDADVEEGLAFRNTFFDIQNEQAAAVETYLSSTLGPPPPDIVLDVADSLPVRIARRSEFLGGADRFDAEFHRKEFVDFEAHLRSLSGVVRLGSGFRAFAGGNPGKGSEIVYRLRQAQLSGFGVSYSGCEEIEDAKAPPKMTLQPDDVLIGCTAHEPHYVGNRVDLIDDLPGHLTNKVIPVPDVMIIRARDDKSQPPASFLASFLRTRWGRRQFQRLNRGVRGGHVYGQDVEKFIYVPVPPPTWITGFKARQAGIRVARRRSIAAMAAANKLIEAALA